MASLHRCFTCLSLFLLLLGSQAAAQTNAAPVVIPFQGLVTTSAGQIVPDGSYAVIFNIYADAVGGQPLWTERHMKVGVINGQLSVFLGSIPGNSVPVSSLDFANVKYLGITIDADGQPTSPDPEMVPRQLLAPAFYAMRAANADKMAGFDWSALFSGGNPQTGTIAGTRITSGTVATNQLQAGLVRSQLASRGVDCQIASVPVSATLAAAGYARELGNLSVGGSTFYVYRYLPLLTVPPGFSLIPGGAFTMGRISGDTETTAPPVTVTVSGFAMQQKETTKAEYDEVRTWAVANGYTDLLVGQGKALNHPKTNIPWPDAVKWCNARSEKEGLTPCYYEIGGGVMRTGLSVDKVDWTADGYRLPTEAEWEKAARGGVAGKRFPWGTDTIRNGPMSSGGQANYYGATTTYSYDLGPDGFNTAFTDGSNPVTAPVGSFAPNAYGLYDMAGNVFEFCWDYYDANYYTISNGMLDPRGPSSGYDRVIRGGSWLDDPSWARCSKRASTTPNFVSNNNYSGFRLARAYERPVDRFTLATAATTGTEYTDGQAAPVDLGTITGASTSIVLHVRNLGTRALTGLTATIDGANADEFSHVFGSTSVPIGGTTTLTITGTAGAVFGGARAAAIHVSATGVTNAFDLNLTKTTAVPAGFALIPSGAFTMGRTSGDTDIDAPPVTVTVSAFVMQQTETTKADWDDVRTWASANGYTDLGAGAGKAANHPVQTITWWDVIKWCNARSQKEGLTPYYNVSGAVMKTGATVPDVNWAANGYRLPTEAEWEKAARGGMAGKRFPWGIVDTIRNVPAAGGGQANYTGNTTAYPTYDLGPNGYNSAFNDGVFPYTGPVGSFASSSAAANGFGLYDMAGNVNEWCWDWYGGTGSYINGASDPQGAVSGPNRVVRGGSWFDHAFYLRCCSRGASAPGNSGNNRGFRLARGRP